MPEILVVAALALAACAGAPVQEMSNARQAIRAARDKAAEALGAAQPGSNTG